MGSWAAHPHSRPPAEEGTRDPRAKPASGDQVPEPLQGGEPSGSCLLRLQPLSLILAHGEGVTLYFSIWRGKEKRWTSWHRTGEPPAVGHMPLCGLIYCLNIPVSPSRKLRWWDVGRRGCLLDYKKRDDFLLGCWKGGRSQVLCLVVTRLLV